MEHEKICKNIDRELEEYADKKELSLGDYQKLQMLTEIKKNFLKIKKLEGEGEYIYKEVEIKYIFNFYCCRLDMNPIS